MAPESWRKWAGLSPGLLSEVFSPQPCCPCSHLTLQHPSSPEKHENHFLMAGGCCQFHSLGHIWRNLRGL